MLGKAEGRRRRGRQRMRWSDGVTTSRDLSLSELWEPVKLREIVVLQSMESQRVKHDGATEQQQNICLISCYRSTTMTKSPC